MAAALTRLLDLVAALLRGPDGVPPTFYEPALDVADRPRGSGRSGAENEPPADSEGRDAAR